jgi:putative Mg2+ transporter-C (MgtC) family protein
MDYEILIRFLLAALWGGLVGIEREYRNKSAGFRTMIMISVGSCCFTMLSVMIGHPGNPDRIASNILTGVGFLGAGVIFRGDNRISGITTAATIWGVAAVGMSIGAGEYFMAGCSSILILVVLAMLPWAEKFIDNINQLKIYKISCLYSENNVYEIEQLLKTHKLKYRLTGQLKENGMLTTEWNAGGRKSRHESFIKAAMESEQIKRFEY